MSICAKQKSYAHYDTSQASRLAWTMPVALIMAADDVCHPTSATLIIGRQGQRSIYPDRIFAACFYLDWYQTCIQVFGAVLIMSYLHVSTTVKLKLMINERNNLSGSVVCL